MTEWQPIETAPKDGTTVIAYRPTNPPHIEGMHCIDGSWYWSYDGDGPNDFSVQPTLWIPIPPVPAYALQPQLDLDALRRAKAI